MNEKRAYTGIDLFRIIAAILVIAIHTSPLLLFGETADFILTGVIARVAVPFFFMTSGFFLISTGNCAKRVCNFVKNTAIIYGIAIALYIPVNIYNNYFSMENLLPNILKDIIFDGTLYHLWYLPAAIIGVIFAWLLVRKCGLLTAFTVTAVLYVVGLFGDSYYGIIKNVPLLEGFYGAIFELSDYTRNGVFFAPIFFVLGGLVGTKKVSLSLKNSLIGFGITLPLMLAEGLLLRNLGVQRHDSFYIMLIPCIVFLFSALTSARGHRVPHLSTIALTMYIIHPMIIVVVRLVAKLIGLQKLLIENSIIHFLAVVIVSIVFSIGFVWVKIKLKIGVKTNVDITTDRAWVELNLDNLRHNALTLQRAMPKGCQLMAVIKSEGYGHGSKAVSTCLNEIGVTAFAVATIDEGIKLRQYGIKGEVLILGYTDPKRAKQLHKNALIQTLIDYDYATKLSQQGYPIKVHIKIDTGMHRLGFEADNIRKIAEIFEWDKFKICGIYTHLGSSSSHNTEDIEFTHMQICTFYDTLESLEKIGVALPKAHIQSSYGLLNYPELECNYARIGIALYGACANVDSVNLQLYLRPVLSLKARVGLIREVENGQYIGYDRQFLTNRNTRIAILPIGYADGFPRILSCGRGKVLLHGCTVPIIGKVCMDQLVIDVTDISDVNVGDIATLIGKDGQAEISATEVAENADTITNELLSRMGGRLKRNQIE